MDISSTPFGHRNVGLFTVKTFNFICTENIENKNGTSVE
jgi:hypothetical protein